MLLLHEVHRVAGRHEDAFESHVDKGLMGALAADNDARLAWHLKLAHGTGRAYFHITVTALRDGASYERVARSLQDGSLRSWAAHADTLRHDVTGTMLLPMQWGPQMCAFEEIPVSGAAGEQALFMQDRAWPHEGRLDDYIEAARTHYAPSLEVQTSRSLLAMVAVFQAAWGSARRREIFLWQRVLFPERLTGLFTHDLPAHVKAPGTWMNDALEVRDDWESQLLRTTKHSPLH